jgi:hypothetical protein
MGVPYSALVQTIFPPTPTPAGTWEAPTIPNPEYKGEWKPKMIENPAYKGIWVAPDIPNPDYVEDNVSALMCALCTLPCCGLA